MDKDGNPVVLGQTSSSFSGHSNAGSYDICLMSFTNTGSWRWLALRGGSRSDWASDLEDGQCSRKGGAPGFVLGKC